MDRTKWLEEKRREAEERYSTLWAPFYWEKFGLYKNDTHQQFIQEFIHLLPQNSVVLDAASGAGRYLPFLLEKEFTIVAIDQAEGMLARAKEKFPSVQFEKVGLQEFSYREVFDGAICMDAMEHVSPEDWPVVLSNFQRALKPQGYLYFTVEIIEEAELKAAFARGQHLGWPLVYGELADEEVYHYYPSIEQVKEWLQQARFVVQQEGEGDLYHHFIVRKE
jgi:cyclopropane fatty-acyl-phospholipid synthase-like methyltransferase